MEATVLEQNLQLCICTLAMLLQYVEACAYTATTTFQEVYRIWVRNDVSISQVTMIPLVYYLISQRKSRTQPHCNGGVARTHVCNQINSTLCVFYPYTDRLTLLYGVWRMSVIHVPVLSLDACTVKN